MLLGGVGRQLRLLRQTREGCNSPFRKTSRTEGWDRAPAVSTQGSQQGFPVPEILKCKGLCDSGKIVLAICGDFPGIFLGAPPADPRNSHSLLEFSCVP